MDGNGAVDVGETEAGSEEYQLAVARDAFVNLRSASTYADVGDQSVVIFVERSGDSTKLSVFPIKLSMEQRSLELITRAGQTR